MAKLTVTPIQSGYLSGAALNALLTDIAAAIENTLSRDGTSPNQLEADIDLNGYRILNSGDAGDEPDALITLEQLQDYIAAHSDGIVAVQIESFTAGVAQTVFNLTDIDYEVGANNLAVYVDGVRKFVDLDFTETDSETVTFLAGMSGGEEVVMLTNQFLGTTAVETHTHPWSQLTNLPSYATRWPAWTEVTGKPTEFAPEDHEHAAEDITSGRMADAQRGVYVQAAEPLDPLEGDLWAW
jgi:hypothetical protein